MAGKLMDSNEVDSKIFGDKVDGSHELRRLVETNHLTTHTNHPSRARHQESPNHMKVSEKNAIADLINIIHQTFPSHPVSECNFIQTSEDKNSSKITRASRNSKRLLCSRCTMYTSYPRLAEHARDKEREKKLQTGQRNSNDATTTLAQIDQRPAP